jgi:hypothetical protein
MSIKVTGNHQIDGATAEIAGHIRDGRIGSHVRWSEQDHYDEAMRLRDEIMAGTRSLPPEPIPADATPMMITDDIALNMAATVLDAMGRPDNADELRALLPEAEGKVYGQPYQERTGKWGTRQE